MIRAVVTATARPTFAVDAAKARADAARLLLTELGAEADVEVVGAEELVMSADDTAAAAEHVDVDRINADGDLVIHVCASFSDASPALTLYRGIQRPVLLWAFREPGPVGDRLWLNSLCGANLFAHALTTRAGGSARLLYGDPEEPAVRAALAGALAGELPPAPELPRPELPRHRRGRAGTTEVAERLDALRGARIGVVGDAPTGFTPCEYDPDLLRELLGIETVRLDIDAAFERVDAVGVRARDAELADASTAQPGLDDLDPEHVRRAASVTVALRSWSAESALAAVAVRCWPEFPTGLGVCPCSSLGRLADGGTATACERDVYGAATMLLLEALGAGTTYLMDCVDLETERNLVRFWHCGSAATRLAADPSSATQSVHCNRRIGVAGNFGLRTGPVMVARLAEDPAAPGALRLLLASGESLPGPNRFQGNTADVRLDCDADAFVHGLVTGGFPHHVVLAWEDVRPRLRTAADQLRIPVVEW